MTASDSQDSADQTRNAPPVGRALRTLVGLALLAYVAPIYLHINARVVLGTVLLMFGLLIVYSVLHALISRRLVALGSGPGALVGLGILVGLYVSGGFGRPFFGRGEGALAAVTFLGISLIVAGVRAQPGCEVMAIPGALFRQRTELACVFFSLTDWLERRWRSKRTA
jgi:hypothetical protein